MGISGKYPAGEYFTLFRGANRLSLDAKGRLAIPTRHRDQLRDSFASKLVITVDPDHSLLLYPWSIWQEIEKKIMSLPTFNEQARLLQRLLVGYATEAEMDGQGRVLLSPQLRQFAGLEKHTIMIGQGNKLELWDEDRWNEKSGEWLEKVDLSQIDNTSLENLSI